MSKHKYYGYNCPVCHEPIKEPQATEHTEDGLAHSECCLPVEKPNTVEHVGRSVIENQLLVALDDKTKVAILANEEDIDILIEALAMQTNKKSREMLADLKQLKQEAFQK